MNILKYIIILIISSTTCYANNNFINNHNILNVSIIIIFLFCYILVILEEFTRIKKSKLTILTAGIMWGMISIAANETYEIIIINKSIKHTLLEYCELFLFLFVAMIYINSLKEFKILEKLKYIILSKKLSYKQIYWLSGFLSFIISPIADNLTTALLMCSIIMSIEKENKIFINLTCINIVVASNAGGAFSPFGDITTLMIWQNNILNFKSFFNIFFPSLISFLVPSLIINFKISNKKPKIDYDKNHTLKKGAFILLFMFLVTICITIAAQIFLNIPSVIGMMTGLGFLYIFEYIQNNKYKNNYNIIKQINKIEWETLLFFYGIMLCISSLSVTGILNNISEFLYNDIGINLSPIHQHTPANIIIGLLSAIIDNIPITFAILNMNPNMNEGQWLLITLTVGIGGSILSIGSAAGIAIMGQAKNIYTFFSHLKWSWAILLGYISGIIVHININGHLFLK